MKRCSICILPESFPGITFNSEGVCSVCSKYKEQSQFVPSMEKFQIKLTEIINEQKSKGKKYDALVAFSGGKDSTFLIHSLKEKYGLNILAFTLDNGFMSDYSFENMRNVVNELNVDHLILKPGHDIMKKIFSKCASEDIYPSHLTKFGSNICISCIRIVVNMSLRIAIEKRIPMVMLGNSPGQLIRSENEIIYQDNKIPYLLRKQLFKNLASRVGEEVYYYVTLTQDEYNTKPFPYTINAFPLIGYDEEEIYGTIKAMGWKKPDDVDPNSTNCRLNSLGIIKHKERYQFHPYDYEMSQLVRLNIISREIALKRVEDPEGKAAALAVQVEKKMRSPRDLSPH
jgi:tRNA(Ile)-lysidine synthase TilS/MesJ